MSKTKLNVHVFEQVEPDPVDPVGPEEGSKEWCQDHLEDPRCEQYRPVGPVDPVNPSPDVPETSETTGNTGSYTIEQSGYTHSAYSSLRTGTIISLTLFSLLLITLLVVKLINRRQPSKHTYKLSKKNNKIYSILLISTFISSLVFAFSTIQQATNAVTSELELPIVAADLVDIEAEKITGESKVYHMSDTVTIPASSSGYTLYLSADDNKLVSREDNANFISSVSSTGQLTANTFGILIGEEPKLDSTYLSLPASNAPIEIYSTEESTEETTYTIYYTVRVDDLLPGNYEGSIEFTAVTNRELTMQDMTEEYCANNIEQGKYYQFTDARDDKTYIVSKYADGNCWMATNLDLDLSTEVTLTSELTDLPADTTWTPNISTQTENGVYWDYGEGECIIDNSCPNYSYDTGKHLDGNLYNAFAATANTTTLDMEGDGSFTVGTASICPSGWFMANESNYTNLFAQYGLSQGELEGNEYLHKIPYLTDSFAGMYDGMGEIFDEEIGYHKTKNGINLGAYQALPSGYFFQYDSNYGYYMLANGELAFGGPMFGKSGTSVRCIVDFTSATVIYDSNAGESEEIIDLPEVEYAEDIENHSIVVKISSLTPKRQGYSFVGWSLSASGSAAYQPGDTFSTSSPQVTLYAQWLKELEGIETMQSMSTEVCNNLTLGEQYGLKDARDGKTYSIAKLADGNCWMTSDLKLDLDNSKPLTSEDTDLNSVEEWTPATTTETEDGEYWGCDGSNCNNTSRSLNYEGNYYYSWFAATAGSGQHETTNTNATDSICPVGWHLPSKNIYQTLIDIYEPVSRDLSGAPVLMNFRGKRRDSEKVNGQNSEYTYWTSTPDGNWSAYNLHGYKNDEVYMGNYYKSYGLGVRCVADTVTFITISFDKNTEDEVAGLPSAIIGSTKQSNGATTFTVPTDLPERANYTFLGYSDQSSDYEPKYEAGNTYTVFWQNEDSPVLYAIWERNPVNLTFDYNDDTGSFNSMVTKLITGPRTITTSSKDSGGNRKTSINDSTQYDNNQNYYDDITIPGAESLNVKIYYSTENANYDWACIFSGTSYTPSSGDSCDDSVSGKLGGGNNPYSYSYSQEYTISGDTARIYFYSDGSVTSYGYWVEITGTTNTNETISGTYQTPTRDGYEFLGWSEDPFAEESTYDKDFSNFPAIMEDKTLYAVWQEKSKTEKAILTEDGNLNFVYDWRTYTAGESYSYKIDGPTISSTIKAVYGIPENPTMIKYPSWLDDADSIVSVNFDGSEEGNFANFQPTSTAYWFAYLFNLENVFNTKNLNTSEVTTMEGMFYMYGPGSSKLTKLDLGQQDTPWDTSKVKNMNDMFNELVNLEELNLYGWKTENVTSMKGMFDGDKSLEALDLSSFDTKNVENMKRMFAGISVQPTFGSSFDTSNVTSMEFMFTEYSPETLNITMFNTANVQNMGHMFYDSSVKTVFVGDGWSTEKVISSYDMFGHSNAHGDLVITGGAGTTWNSNNPTDKTYARIDRPDLGQPGYFTDIADKPAEEKSEPLGVQKSTKSSRPDLAVLAVIIASVVLISASALIIFFLEKRRREDEE